MEMGGFATGTLGDFIVGISWESSGEYSYYPSLYSDVAGKSPKEMGVLMGTSSNFVWLQGLGMGIPQKSGPKKQG